MLIKLSIENYYNIKFYYYAKWVYYYIFLKGDSYFGLNYFIKLINLPVIKISLVKLFINLGTYIN